MEKTMKAVMIDKPTKGEDVVLSRTAVPEEKPGWVVVKVKAFGMNHSEEILREFEVQNDYIQKPIIPGIECVGEIVNASDSGWKVGQKVVALMGGMGRSFNGSYAESTHCFPFIMYFLLNRSFYGWTWLQSLRLILQHGDHCFSACG